MQAKFCTALFDDVIYVGFWRRVGATVVDTFILALLCTPLLIAIYGWDYFTSDQFTQGFADLIISWFFPVVAVLLFWKYQQATPGKMVVGAIIIDAKTGGVPSFWQYLLRYASYFIAVAPLGLGILWVALDKRKQGWHDKIAGTVVVRIEK